MPRPVVRRQSRFPRWSVSGIEAEALTAGVLGIVLVLVMVRAFLPSFALPAVGLAAFAALSGIGILVLRTPGRGGRHGDLLLGIIAALAIVWIAAGRLMHPEF